MTDLRWDGREREEPNMRPTLNNSIVSKTGDKHGLGGPGQPWHQLRRNAKGNDEKKRGPE